MFRKGRQQPESLFERPAHFRLPSVEVPFRTGQEMPTAEQLIEEALVLEACQTLVEKTDSASNLSQDS